MNKKELIQAASSDSDMSYAMVEKALNSLQRVMVTCLQREERISLTGIGRFEIRERAARKGYNPGTREAIEIPARKAVVFKPGSLLCVAVEKKVRSVSTNEPNMSLS